MNNTVFTFVRHGESVGNVTGILQGNIDSPLDELGLRQADAVADALKARSFDLIVSSPLQRAAVTAQKIAAFHPGIELQYKDALREWHCGSYEGKPWKELFFADDQRISAFFQEEGDVRFPEGESRMEFQLRVETLLKELLAKHRGQKILIVSHGGVLQRIFRFVSGVTSPGNLIPLADNASISEFIWNEAKGAWQLTHWNDCGHLAAVAPHPTILL